MLRLRMTAFAAALMLPAALALTAPATGQQKTTIGVSLAQDDNPFYIAMLRGIRARAQELGWEVATVSANEDKLKQINGVQDLVARIAQPDHPRRHGREADRPRHRRVDGAQARRQGQGRLADGTERRADA